MNKKHFIKIRELIEKATFDIKKREYSFITDDIFSEAYHYTYINRIAIKEIRYIGDRYGELYYDDGELSPYQILTFDNDVYITSKVFVNDLLEE